MAKRITTQSLLFEQQLLAILVFTVLVICVWIVASVYFSYSSAQYSESQVITVTPLSPKIDRDIFDQLEQRTWWSPQDLETFTPSIDLSEK